MASVRNQAGDRIASRLMSRAERVEVRCIVKLESKVDVLNCEVPEGLGGGIVVGNS